MSAKILPPPDPSSTNRILQKSLIAGAPMVSPARGASRQNRSFSLYALLLTQGQHLTYDVQEKNG